MLKYMLESLSNRVLDVVCSNLLSKKVPLKDTNNSKVENSSEVLSTWVEEHGDYLYRYALRYYREQSVAEDVVQETFLAATASIKQFEGRSSPRTWLISILRHKLHDRLRKKQKDESIVFENELLDYTDNLFDAHEHWTKEAGPLTWKDQPDNIFEQKEFLSVLEGCLAKVPESQRQIFILREIDGFEREEISEKLGLTATNIGVILHRVRLALQSCLQRNWYSKIFVERTA
jgi:RNA polymerase sigma-70 factor, ECF subfamily